MAKKAVKASVQTSVVDAKAFHDLLKSFSFVDRHTTGEIQLQFEKDLITVAGSSAMMKMRKTLACSGSAVGVVTVNGAKVQQTLKALAGEVVVSIDDGKMVMEQTNRSYKIVAPDQNDPIGFSDKFDGVKWPGEFLRHGLQKAGPFCSKDPVRPAMCGVHFTGKIGEGVKFIGTTGHILCLVQYPNMAVAKDFAISIPSEACRVLGGIAATEFDVHLTENSASFQFEGGLFETLLTTEQYPNALALVNEITLAVKHTVVWDVKQVEHIKRLCAIYAGSDHAVRLFIGKDKVTGRSEDADFGGSAVQWSQEPNEQLAANLGSQVNLDYFGLCLDAIDTKTVAVRLSDVNTGALMFSPTEEVDGQKLLVLLMPQRWDTFAEEMARHFEVQREAA